MPAFPLQAAASCIAGSPLSYEDIRYVAVGQFSLTGQLHPSFSYEGHVHWSRASLRADASLDAKRAVKFKGSFVAVDPMRTFRDIVLVLQQNAFFSMRLNPATNLYVDGPEDGVTVTACGVTWTIATTNRAEETSLSDPAAKAFFSLMHALRDTIFSERWMSPSPTPSP
ncbi:MAG TPA: hypothetical protein VGM99_05355 [Candidatus Cybelea sp.]